MEQEVVPPAVVAGKWEDEVRRAAQLANAWDIGSSTVPSEEPATTEFPPPTMDPQMPTTEPEPFEPSPPAPFEPPLPEPQVSEPAWADMTAAPVQTEHAPAWHRQLQSAAAEVKAEQPTPVGRLEKAPEGVPPFSPDMEAIIAKVLAKMNPEVLQQVSREILKPVIEALLRDEIGKKS